MQRQFVLNGRFPKSNLLEVLVLDQAQDLLLIYFSLKLVVFHLLLLVYQVRALYHLHHSYLIIMMKSGIRKCLVIDYSVSSVILFNNIGNLVLMLFDLALTHTILKQVPIFKVVVVVVSFVYCPRSLINESSHFPLVV